MPSLKVKNLGVVFDQYLIFNDYINEICHKSIYQIHKLDQLKKYLDTKSLASLVHAFVILLTDYCKILYSYSLNNLQRIKKISARLITQPPKF